jgi:hypothetical protein
MASYRNSRSVVAPRLFARWRAAGAGADAEAGSEKRIAFAFRLLEEHVKNSSKRTELQTQSEFQPHARPMVNMTFQTRPEGAATGDVGLWLLIASEIATHASFNFGASDFASATLWPANGVCRVGRDDLPNNHKIKQHPHRSFPCLTPQRKQLRGPPHSV